ncbi:hypothetical protein GCM10022225_21520 [Plantactinospora mayteni]|uniref:Uncharacterized protein n=1 Tax=Plantactinospora mayteni TaxID=566021 RepID=A0ABQ4ENV3_9ACTN|nr:hypothetical protein [Plantactinospora mayteni]GIG96333.1 hypothetical protein Pma05_29060 [Plantactinospora mayteni]
MRTDMTSLALWDPGWYDLDQPLKVGRQDRFAFHHGIVSPGYDLVFANGLGTNWDYRSATVETIEHPEFGLLDEVDTTTGFGEYTFRLQDGRWVTVEAEESPGAVNAASPDFPVDASRAGSSDWALVVVLSGVTNANRG